MDRPPEPTTADADAGTHTVLVIPTPLADHVCRLAEQFPRDRVDAPVAHITITTPFLLEADLNSEVHAALTDIAGSRTSFSCRLTTCRHFDNGWYYLAPDDPTPFIELNAAISTRFPSLQPDEGRATGVIPHMSVGVERDPEHRIQLMQSVVEKLPILVQVSEILLVRSGPRYWVTLARFPLQNAG